MGENGSPLYTAEANGTNLDGGLDCGGPFHVDGTLRGQARLSCGSGDSDFRGPWKTNPTCPSLRPHWSQLR